MGFDLVEVLPPYDPTQITSLLAATIIHEFASLVALKINKDSLILSSTNNNAL
nr:arginase family protein [Bacillus sp. AFS031507]